MGRRPSGRSGSRGSPAPPPGLRPTLQGRDSCARSRLVPADFPVHLVSNLTAVRSPKERKRKLLRPVALCVAVHPSVLPFCLIRTCPPRSTRAQQASLHLASSKRPLSAVFLLLIRYFSLDLLSGGPSVKSSMPCSMVITHFPQLMGAARGFSGPSQHSHRVWHLPF